MNKISKTRVGDDIHYYVNGVEDRGIVAKMGSTYITVFKEDGKFYDIPVNDTFHVSEILVNKTWDSMTLEERTEELQKAHAYSPRFLTKSWDDLPQELRDVMKRTTGKDDMRDSKVEFNEGGQVKNQTEPFFRHEDALGNPASRSSLKLREAKPQEGGGSLPQTRASTGSHTRLQGHYNDQKTKLPPTGKQPTGAKTSTTGYDKLTHDYTDSSQGRGFSDSSVQQKNRSPMPKTASFDELIKSLDLLDKVRDSKGRVLPDTKNVRLNRFGRSPSSRVTTHFWGKKHPRTTPAKGDPQSFQGQSTHARTAYLKPHQRRGDKFTDKRPIANQHARGTPWEDHKTFKRSKLGNPKNLNDDDRLRDSRTFEVKPNKWQKLQRDLDELEVYRSGKTPQPKKVVDHTNAPVAHGSLDTSDEKYRQHINEERHADSPKKRQRAQNRQDSKDIREEQRSLNSGGRAMSEDGKEFESSIKRRQQKKERDDKVRQGMESLKALQKSLELLDKIERKPRTFKKDPEASIRVADDEAYSGKDRRTGKVTDESKRIPPPRVQGDYDDPDEQSMTPSGLAFHLEDRNYKESPKNEKLRATAKIPKKDWNKHRATLDAKEAISLKSLKKSLELLDKTTKKYGAGRVAPYEGYNIDQKRAHPDSVDTPETKFFSAYNPKKFFHTKEDRDKYDNRFKGFESKKSDVEQGVYGNAGSRPNVGVSTATPIDAEEDYEGQSHEDYKEQFKHEKKKPKTSMTGHGKKKE